MREHLYSDPVTVIVNTVHTGNVLAGEAVFIWPQGPAVETYNMTVDKLVSIDFDKHLPVRPEHMRWLSPIVKGEVIEPTLTQQLLPEHQSSMFAATIVLDGEMRLKLAKLQAEDLRTPTLLRELCAAMVGSAAQVSLEVTVE